MNLNQPLFDLIHQFANRSVWLDDIGIFLAQYLPYLLVLGFLVLAFGRKDWRMRVLIFSEGALAVILSRGIVTQAIRFFYHHLRPFAALNFTPLINESGYSFPSGHAAWFFAISMVVFYYSRKWGIWYFLLSILNGLARIYVGVHWPLDILGGIVVGVLCGMLAHRLLKPSLEKLKSRAALA